MVERLLYPITYPFPQNSITFVYYPERIVDAIIDYWQYMLGAVIALIVVFLTFAIFWRCNLFNRVRIYRQDDFEEDEDVDTTTNIKDTEPSETKVEEVELRNLS